MVMGGPPLSRRVPMTTGRPRGDGRVPMVSPWRQEDLTVTGGPHGDGRTPGVQEGPHGVSAVPTVPGGSPW